MDYCLHGHQRYVGGNRERGRGFCAGAQILHAADRGKVVVCEYERHRIRRTLANERNAALGHCHPLTMGSAIVVFIEEAWRHGELPRHPSGDHDTRTVRRVLGRAEHG